MSSTTSTLPLARIGDFIRLGRPLFLVGGVVLYALGVSTALASGARLDLPALILGQIAVTATQLMVHYANDYFDQAPDRANTTPTPWSGGSRMLVEGRIAPGAALAASLALLFIALVTTGLITLLARPGLAVVAALLAAIFLAWSYSAPPLRLVASGLGEAAVVLVVPGLTPLIAYMLQTGRGTLSPILAALPLCFLQFAMLMTIQFPDVEGDAATGKRTLVVRLGAKRGAQIHNGALLLAYLTLGLGVTTGGIPLLPGLLAMLTAPAAAWQGWRVAGGAWHRPSQWGSLAFWGIGLLVATAALETAGFMGMYLL